MKKTGGQLIVHALEQIGVKYTFGIPGVHNTEIYDELNKSKQIEPILVTHEGGASFMADGVSRTSDSIGTIVTVPAAGTTHAMSGIGEAFLDGVPMLIISGGTRRDIGKHYQLHQIDQEVITKGLVKGFYLIEKHEDIIPTIYEAYTLATTGESGPVFIEVPVELQLFTAPIDKLPSYIPKTAEVKDVDKEIAKAVELLAKAKIPTLYLGWGAVDVTEYSTQIAELLGMPVATTFQGMSAFSGEHPLHCGVGFGSAGQPAAKNAYKDCDCMLAVGLRFGELATGSYGVNVPENLIHIDINPEVFNKNYIAKVAIEGDSKRILPLLLKALKKRAITSARDQDILHKQIAKDKASYRAEWLKDKKSNIVSPGHLFNSLRNHLDDHDILLSDDGNHTFLCAELYKNIVPRGFISPTDFNCMGYCIPASIGVALSNPDKQIVSVVGDGAFMMTCMELVTATSLGIGLVVFIFNDGELGQISQFQKIPLNRKTCTTVGKVNFEGVAIATGAHFLIMDNDHQINDIIKEALSISKEGKPVIVDVNIDYSKKTLLTKGVVKTNLERFPLSQKIRFLARALKRHTLG